MRTQALAMYPASTGCVGVPATGPFLNTAVQNNSQLNAIASGSAFAGFPIGPESGKSFDVGIVYDPNWLEGLSVSADLWRLYLNNNIVNIGAQQVIDLCFAGQEQFCPLIRRFQSGDTQGNIQTLLEPTGNLGRLDVSGVNFALNYRLPEFSFGRFNVALNATYMKKYDLQTAPGLGGNTTFHYAGHFMNFGSAQAASCPGAGGGICGATTDSATVASLPKRECFSSPASCGASRGDGSRGGGSTSEPCSIDRSASRSCSARTRADCGRPLGSLARQLSITRAKRSGTSGTSARIGRTGSRTCMIISIISDSC